MDRAVDVLHPLVSLKLEWRECRKPLVAVGDADAVWLKDKVYYVGGGVSPKSKRDLAKLYIYTPATDTWATLNTPVYFFALTTYNSQLVLVGGRKYMGESVDGELSNKLWTLNEDGQWQETLPPIPTLCDIVFPRAFAVSHRDYLLVISDDHDHINRVYVYNGHHWASAQHPPQQLHSIKSIVFNGYWYLMGKVLHESRKTGVYSASLDSLLANYQPSETSQPLSLWKRLPDVPSERCYPAVFGNRLVAVEGSTGSLYAYSSLTQSWELVPISMYILGIITPCDSAVPLPYNTLMIVSGQIAFQSELTLTPFNPDNSFTRRALDLLESAAGIPVMRTLSDYTFHIQNILGLPTTNNLGLNGLLNYWINDIQCRLHPSWRNLLQIIRQLNQDKLAQRIEKYLSAGIIEGLSPTRGRQGDDQEVYEQIRLKDDKIFQLKQRVSDLEHKNKELEELLQIPTKEEEDTKPFIHEEKAITLLPGVQEELKEEPLTLEGEHVPRLSVQGEIKEETVPITKVPTTATWNLRGVEVYGEMTAVVYSSHDQQIIWHGYGLRLNIPKDCLPAGMEQCTINIKASLAGQYEFPENFHLISAIFWLRCEDVCKFTKPITVEIQHCAKSENIMNIKLSFIRAVCHQKQLPYIFKQLPGGNFTSHSSYGVIELNSFSGVGVTQEDSEDREYCSQLFYLGQPDLCKIHFVVSWNVEAHLTEVLKKYKEEGAILGLHTPVEFEAEAISLDIPMEGLSLKGWKITPLIRPVVTKKQVDNFREGKLTPCCQLKAQVVGRRKKIPLLSHQVKLEGAKHPHDMFTIDLPAEDPNSQPSGTLNFGDLAAAAHPGPPPSKRSRLGVSASGASTAGPSSANGLDTKLMKPELKDLIKELYTRASEKWEDIGILLGIDPGRLDAIKTAENNTPQSRLREMLKIWVTRVSPPPSWAAIAEAVELLGDQTLADQLRTKYHVLPHQN